MTQIAFYLPELHDSAPIRGALYVAQELQRRGHAVCIFADQAGGALEPKFAASMPVIPLKPPFKALTGPALAQRVRSEAIETLIAVTTPAMLVAAAMKRLGLIRTPVVGWEHRLLSTLRNGRRLSGIIDTHLARAVLPACDKIIFATHGAQEDAIRVCAPNPLHAVQIYTPVKPTGKWALSPADQIILSRTKAPRIVSGKIASSRDGMALLRAFHYFSRTHDGSLIVIGAGVRRGVLEHTASCLGLGERVAFADDDGAALLAHADLFISTSSNDYTGAELVEALAVGVPVAALDCATAPREILNEETYGRLAPPGDARALSRAVRETLKTPVDRAMLRARAGEFSIERVTDAVVTALALPTPAANAAQRAA